MKASQLMQMLTSLPEGHDPEIVTGEEWLPERLIEVRDEQDLLFLEFDNAPEDNQGDDEGRGFVEHEITLIKKRIMDIFLEKASLEHKQQAILALVLYAHEHFPSEVVEMLEMLDDETE